MKKSRMSSLGAQTSAEVRVLMSDKIKRPLGSRTALRISRLKIVAEENTDTCFVTCAAAKKKSFEPPLTGP